MSYFIKFRNRIRLIRHQKGLTLIEAMVALLVLSLGLIPALAIITSSLNISLLIKNNLIAANLAQEGIEVTRSLRDANWLEGRSFDDGLIGTWAIDSNTSWGTSGEGESLPIAVTPGGSSPLKFDSTTGLYNYSDGGDTNFKREVTLTLSSDPCNCDLIVVSEVSWLQKSQIKTIKAETHLFDWR